ncbi:MAG: biotin attachment protein [Candidatus Poseidoniales archaeon]|nr:biotin attachment protein [Candidatus Poseidoniales archaeon]|tara:strand:- start:839 stop:1291 length:453 start_codon:yes stop_codon:yes gene_type:complete
MEFKTSDGRYEIEPNRDGSSFVHDGIIVHAGGEIWLEIDGRKHKATATKVGDVWWVHVLGHTLQYEIIEAGATGSNEDNGLTAPMPGKILDVLVSQGQSVSQGDALMVMEAMKMEHKIIANCDGVVESIHFNTGDQVQQGAELLSIVENE